MFYTYHNPYNDSYYYSNPFGPSRSRRRSDLYYRRQQEQARAEAEEAARIRYLQQQQRQREQEELRERELYERLWQQKQDARRARQQQQRQHGMFADHDDDHEEPLYEIVRGRDGRLYYLQKQPSFQKHEEEEEQMEEDGSEGESDAGDHDDHSTAMGLSTKITREPLRTTITETEPSKPKLKKRVAIIVEDASDSEAEDDDYRSPWRNRRPSPGEWMEPVDIYNR